MPYLDKSQACIYQLPSELLTHKGSITIGDLHANVMKLIHFLMSYGVIYFPQDAQKHYAELVQIYSDVEQLFLELSELKEEGLGLGEAFKVYGSRIKDRLDQFNNVIDLLKICDSPPLVRLIGDELADRGCNDYFMLKMIVFLKQNNINLRINLSNHGNAFLFYYDNFFYAKEKNKPITSEQRPSLKRFKSLLRDFEYISCDKVKDWVENYYLPSIYAIDYQIEKKKITLFTHAPIEFGIIARIAKQLKLEPTFTCLSELTQLIDNINAVITKEIQAHNLYQFAYASSKGRTREYRLENNPLYYLVWNRWNDALEQENSNPDKIENFELIYVHGHDSYQSTNNHVFNLNNLSGKESYAIYKSAFTAIQSMKSKPWTLFQADLRDTGVVLRTIKPAKDIEQAKLQASFYILLAKLAEQTPIDQNALLSWFHENSEVWDLLVDTPNFFEEFEEDLYHIADFLDLVKQEEKNLKSQQENLFYNMPFEALNSQNTLTAQKRKRTEGPALTDKRLKWMSSEPNNDKADSSESEPTNSMNL